MLIFLCISLEKRQRSVTSNTKFEAVSHTQRRRQFRLKFYIINCKSDETIRQILRVCLPAIFWGSTNDQPLKATFFIKMHIREF